jgi:hypothetical protein
VSKPFVSTTSSIPLLICPNHARSVCEGFAEGSTVFCIYSELNGQLSPNDSNDRGIRYPCQFCVLAEPSSQPSPKDLKSKHAVSVPPTRPNRLHAPCRTMTHLCWVNSRSEPCLSYGVIYVLADVGLFYILIDVGSFFFFGFLPTGSIL